MYLAIASIVGVITLLNLVLTVGVIRRLREHTDQLSRVAVSASDAIVPMGTRIGKFTATTTDGELVSDDRLTGRTMVAFFSPGCPACKSLLPKFIDYAVTVPGGRQQVLAVVVGDSDETSAEAQSLLGCARVVRGGYDDAVMKAFAIRAFPGVCMVEADGIVAIAGADLAGFPVPAAV